MIETGEWVEGYICTVLGEWESLKTQPLLDIFTTQEEVVKINVISQCFVYSFQLFILQAASSSPLAYYHKISISFTLCLELEASEYLNEQKSKMQYLKE